MDGTLLDARRRSRLVVAAYTIVLASAAAPRLWAAWLDHGVFWPDEIYQSLEQGHRFAFGYGLVPWEFRDGARSWLMAGAIGLLMKLGSAVGLGSGLAIVAMVKTCVALFSTFGCYGAMRLAHKLSGEAAAIFAGAMYAACPVLVFFGSRCLSDVISAPFLVVAATLLVDRAASRWRVAGAGALVGLAVFCRYQNGLLAVGFVGALLAARRWRHAGDFALGGAVVAIAGGVLDWVTWGTPFASFLHYVRFNVTEGLSAGWGSEPFTYYGQAYWTAVGWPLAILVLGWMVSFPRAPGLVVVTVLYVLVHCLLGVKQVRFLIPALPIVVALAGVGIADTMQRGFAPRRILAEGLVVVGAAALAIAMALRVPRETFGSMGYYALGPNPAWHYGEKATLLMSRAGSRPDLCGLIYGGVDWGYSGGYSYLHRDVPLFRDANSDEIASANYLVAARGARVPAGYEQVDTEDTWAIYRRDGECAPAPAWYSHKLER